MPRSIEVTLYPGYPYSYELGGREPDLTEQYVGFQMLFWRSGETACVPTREIKRVEQLAKGKRKRQLKGARMERAGAFAVTVETADLDPGAIYLGSHIHTDWGNELHNARRDQLLAHQERARALSREGSGGALATYGESRRAAAEVSGRKRTGAGVEVHRRRPSWSCRGGLRQ
jgi:hypothetical protein